MFLRQLQWICPGIIQQCNARVISRTLCSHADTKSSITDEHGLGKSRREQFPVVRKYHIPDAWKKDAEHFIINLSEEGLKKKRELELFIEVWKHDNKYDLHEISPFDWKILLTECEEITAKQRYLEYLYEREKKEKFRYAVKQQNAKQRIRELLELESNEDIRQFSVPWVVRDKYQKRCKGLQTLKSDVQVIIDLDFEVDLREQRVAFLLLQTLWGSNLSHLQPLDIHCTSINKNYRMRDVHDADARVFVTTHKKHFLDVFPHKDLVYLSPDGPPMTEFDSDCTYIIGGSLDMSVKRQETLNIAKKHGIKCASLPILTYYKLEERGTAVLSFNCVYKIILDMYLNRSWKDAFLKHLPGSFTIREDLATKEDLKVREYLFPFELKVIFVNGEKMLGSLRQPCQCTCRCFLQNGTPGLIFTAVRKYENPQTAVFERMHKVNNVGQKKYPLLKRRHYILNKIPPSDPTYKTTMMCILTKEIDGIGLKGTVVEVPKRLFRNQLYPSGAAVYASPENIELYEEYRKESEEEGIDYEIKQLMRKMAGFHLRVFMNGLESWTLEPVHLKVAFRKMGVVLGEDNIIMPDKKVQNMGDFSFRIQMNERIACQVRGTVYPVGEDGLPDSDIEYPPIWGNPLIDPSRPTEYLKKKGENIENAESVLEENVIDEDSNDNKDNEKT